MKIIKNFSLFLFILCFQSLIAQSEYSFEDFDYPEETVTWGSKSKSTYFIPMGENQRLLTGSKLFLNFKTSEVLNFNKSFVTVAVNNIPFSTKRPSQDGNSIDFQIPLSQRQVNSGFIRIDVISDLKILDEYCEVYNEGAFWLRRLGTSQIVLNIKENKEIQSNTISSYIKQVKAIYLPENPTLTNVKYAAYIQFYFKNELGRKLEVKTLPKSLDSIKSKSVLLGELRNFDDLPGKQSITQGLNSEKGLVKLHHLKKEDTITGDAGTEPVVVLVTGNDLTGFEKAAQSFLDKDILQSAFTSSYQVDQGKDLKSYIKDDYQEISFRNLGVSEEITEGVGKMKKEITFPKALFPPGLSKLSLNLKFAYRPLKDNEAAYVNIYMNDVLKYSNSLNNFGSFDDVLHFDSVEFRQQNNLKVEYYYIPEGGQCVVNPSSFYAQIDLNNSRFVAEAFNKREQLSFGTFQQHFSKNKTNIYWDSPNNPQDISVIGELLEVFNSDILTKEGYIYPNILPLDSLQSNINSHNGIIITSNSTSLQEFESSNAYVAIDKDKYYFEKEDFNRYFNIQYAENIALNQLFESGDKEFMFIYNPKERPETLARLVQDIEESNFSSSDIILANENNSYSFSLRNINKPDKEEIEGDFDAFWKNYGIIIIFGFLILMIVLLIYIFQKSQESKNSIIENK
ncbi:cellulose biosynthesis cyclic di-GMP-binding regulatory protein BcsB [Salegentibacter salarius]|nr:cellulose biosynthesis cyclic di-GMP-binding regulatory protein BcsB [Salegentibacter salarius]OEY71350.1 hypothetical protein BHS39_06595 [Salegentibacter salarius]